MVDHFKQNHIQNKVATFFEREDVIISNKNEDDIMELKVMNIDDEIRVLEYKINK